MSHYRPYPAYKDSGVEWLGKVPTNWTVMSIKHIVSTPITDGPHETPDFVNEGIPFVSAEAISSGSIDFSKIRGFITEADHQRYSQKYHPEKGDIFMIKSGATTGVTAIVETDIDFNIWSPLAVIRCGQRSTPRFVLNFMRSRSFQEAVTLSWSYGTQQNIGMGVIGDIAITVPSIEEQKTITAHLDLETIRIDALITKKTRFIELLREKRQALITNAVTKGIDPHAKMKDSGVEWLGRIPAHWDVKPLKYLLQVNGLVRGPFGGDLKKEIFVSQGIKVYEQKNAIYQDAELGESFITQEKFSEMHRFKVRSGDYIMSCSGTIGRTYRLPDIAPVGIINQALLIIRFNNQISNEFADWIFVSDFFTNQILDNSQGGAMKNLVGMDIFTSIFIQVPQLDEQKSIARYLNRETTLIDSLVVKTQRSIELLKERRSSLITAAVTGQIDLRESA